MKNPLRYIAPLGLCLLVVLSACSGNDPSAAESESVAPPATVEVQVTEGASDGEASGAETGGAASEDGRPRDVTIETADGVTLAGTTFGFGETAIVFSHMFPTDQTSWQPFAQRAAEQGYSTLTYDFRGYGASGGSQDVTASGRDVQAAYDFVRAQGAQQVVLVGAEIGGMASIKVASTLGSELAGLVVLSSPQSFEGLEVTSAELAGLSMPSLWLSARTDMVTANLETMYDGAAGDKSIWIFEGSGVRGTFIFDAPLDGEDLAQRLLDFFSEVAPTTP